MKRLSVLVFAVIVLAGCGEYTAGPECIRGHHERRTELVYTPECGLGFDGKYDCGKMKAKWVTRDHYVCDEYAKEVTPNEGTHGG